MVSLRPTRRVHIFVPAFLFSEAKMSKKPFKTIDDQINILKDQNLLI